MIARTPSGVARRTIPAGVEVYEVNGPFFFGAADKIKDVLRLVAKKPKVLHPADAQRAGRWMRPAFACWTTSSTSFSHQRIRFLIAGIQRSRSGGARTARAGWTEYGRENFVATIDEALETRRVAHPRQPG